MLTNRVELHLLTFSFAVARGLTVTNKRAHRAIFLFSGKTKFNSLWRIDIFQSIMDFYSEFSVLLCELKKMTIWQAVESKPPNADRHISDKLSSSVKTGFKLLAVYLVL